MAANKKILFIFSQPPFGNYHIQEAIDLLLALSNFDFEISLVFTSDASWLLKKSQDGKRVGQKDYCAIFKALSIYDINDVFMTAENLALQGLADEDLIISAKIINQIEMQELLKQQTLIFNY